MEQRDLLRDQIEQLGKVLAEILSDFLGLKSKGNATEGFEISNERFQAKLDIDIEKLINLDNGDLREYINTHKLTETHLEILSEYLGEAGRTKTDFSKKEPYLKKSIKLLDVADEVSKTMSFDRINKKSKMENMLQQDV